MHTLFYALMTLVGINNHKDFVLQYFKTCLFLSCLFASYTVAALDNIEIEKSVIKTVQAGPAIIKTPMLDSTGTNHHPSDVSEKDKKVIDSVAGKNISQLELELELLQNQNELIKEYQSSLLSTVYWSLSALMTITVLLIGFGWWSNSRMHEKDKERLKDEVKILINEMESKVDIGLANNRTEYLMLLDSRLDSLAERFSNENSTIKTDVSEKFAEFKKVSKKLDSFISSTGKTLMQYSKNLSISEADLRLVEETVWEIRKVPRNVIITQVQGINAAVMADNSGRVSIVLNRMKETLEKLVLEQKYTINEFIETSIKRALTKANIYHPIDTAKVYEILKSVPIDRDK